MGSSPSKHPKSKATPASTDTVAAGATATLPLPPNGKQKYGTSFVGRELAATSTTDDGDELKQQLSRLQERYSSGDEASSLSSSSSSSDENSSSSSDSDSDSDDDREHGLPRGMRTLSPNKRPFNAPSPFTNGALRDVAPTQKTLDAIEQDMWERSLRDAATAAHEQQQASAMAAVENAEVDGTLSLSDILDGKFKGTFPHWDVERLARHIIANYVNSGGTGGGDVGVNVKDTCSRDENLGNDHGGNDGVSDTLPYQMRPAMLRIHKHRTHHSVHVHFMASALSSKDTLPTVLSGGGGDKSSPSASSSSSSPASAASAFSSSSSHRSGNILAALVGAAASPSTPSPASSPAVKSPEVVRQQKKNRANDFLSMLEDEQLGGDNDVAVADPVAAETATHPETQIDDDQSHALSVANSDTRDVAKHDVAPLSMAARLSVCRGPSKSVLSTAKRDPHALKMRASSVTKASHEVHDKIRQASLAGFKTNWSTPSTPSHEKSPSSSSSSATVAAATSSSTMLTCKLSNISEEGTSKCFLMSWQVAVPVSLPNLDDDPAADDSGSRTTTHMRMVTVNCRCLVRTHSDDPQHISPHNCVVKFIPVPSPLPPLFDDDGSDDDDGHGDGSIKTFRQQHKSQQQQQQQQQPHTISLLEGFRHIDQDWSAPSHRPYLALWCARSATIKARVKLVAAAAARDLHASSSSSSSLSSSSSKSTSQCSSKRSSASARQRKTSSQPNCKVLRDERGHVLVPMKKKQFQPTGDVLVDAAAASSVQTHNATLAHLQQQRGNKP